MTIPEAIYKAKQERMWVTLQDEPTSVNIAFTTKDGREDETQFDLWGYNPEKELEELWTELSMELDSDCESVTSVEALGYIE